MSLNLVLQLHSLNSSPSGNELSVSARWLHFLSFFPSFRLPTMLNRKLVDELAVEFCMTLNTKICRKKLAKALFSVEKNR